jgi:hypothetical protein
MFQDNPQYCIWNLHAICIVIVLYVLYTVYILHVYDLLHNLVPLWQTSESTEYMYVWMYVSMYVRMNVCIYVCTYVCMYICMYVRIYVCIYVCMHACKNAVPTADITQQQTEWKDNYAQWNGGAVISFTLFLLIQVACNRNLHIMYMPPLRFMDTDHEVIIWNTVKLRVSVKTLKQH